MKCCAMGYHLQAQRFAPSRGRELKCVAQNGIKLAVVRPLAGAGIEMKPVRLRPALSTVRPLAGAGIEMKARESVRDTLAGFAPSRGRELKFPG